MSKTWQSFNRKQDVFDFIIDVAQYILFDLQLIYQVSVWQLPLLSYCKDLTAFKQNRNYFKPLFFCLIFDNSLWFIVSLGLDIGIFKQKHTITENTWYLKNCWTCQMSPFCVIFRSWPRFIHLRKLANITGNKIFQKLAFEVITDVECFT